MFFLNFQSQENSSNYHNISNSDILHFLTKDLFVDSLKVTLITSKYLRQTIISLNFYLPSHRKYLSVSAVPYL